MLVLVFWSLQYLALPFLADATYLVHRAITPLPVVGMTTLAYFVVGPACFRSSSCTGSATR